MCNIYRTLCKVKFTLSSKKGDHYEQMAESRTI